MPPERLIANRYRVIDSLGSGGAAAVFKVEDRDNGDIRALKRIDPIRTSEDELERFHREFRLLGRLEHAHIVRVHDTGTDGTLPFFTMDFVEGQTLEQALTRPDEGLALTLRSDLTVLIDFIAQICDALSTIHGGSGVHRDLKPSNLMLPPNGDPLHVTVLDLGTARFRDNVAAAHTTSGQMLGTVHYMAPEQVRGTGIDGRADLYALGCILYEILTGRRPFHGDSAVNVAMQHLQEIPVPPRVHNLDIPHHLQLAILRLLEKAPDDRYRSAEDLILDLRNPETAQPTALALPEVPALMLTPRFLGRRVSVGKARHLISEVQTGKGVVLAIGGEPGVGKTRFLEEVCADARVMGLRTLNGVCYHDNASPFGAVVEALRGGFGDTGLWNWSDLEDRRLLSRILPELADDAVRAVPEEFQRADRAAIIEAVVRLLKGATTTGPLLMCLDDVQWADEPTLALIEALTKEMGSLPLMLLVGHRPLDSDDLPKWMLAAERIEMAPLDRESTEELIASVTGSAESDEDLVSEVFNVSGGNPFSTIEAVRALEERGVLRWKRNQWHYRGIGGELPERIEWLIRQRVDRLTPSRRRILELAAILDRPFNFEWLLACDLGDEDSLHAESGWLISHNFLRRPTDDTYGLFHALIGESVHGSLPDSQRQSLHREVANALAARHDASSADQYEEIANHYRAAGDDLAALPFLVDAGNALLRACEYERAGSVLLAAYDISNLRGAQPDTAVKAASAYLSYLKVSASSPDNLLDVVDTVESKFANEPGLAEVLVHRAKAWSALGRASEAESLLAELADSTQARQDPRVHLRVRVEIISIQMRQSRDATSDIRAAKKLCSGIGDPFHAAYLQFLEGHLLLVSGQAKEALDLMKQARQGFQDVSHLGLVQSSARAICEINLHQMRLDDAERELRKLIQEDTSPVERFDRNGDLAAILSEAGQLSAAKDLFRRCLQTEPELVGKQKKASTRLRYAECLLRLGDHEGSSRNPIGIDTAKTALFHSVSGQLAQHENRLASAREELDRACRLAKEQSSLRVGKYLRLLSDIERKRGDIQAANRHLEQAVTFYLSIGAEEGFVAKLQKELSEMKEQTSLGAAGPPPASPEQELLSFSLQRIKDVAGAERALVMTLSDEGKNGQAVLISRSEDSLVDISDNIVRKTIEQGSTLLAEDAREDGRFSESKSIIDHDIRSVVCVPFFDPGGKAFGAVYVDHKGVAYFSEERVRLIETIAAFISLAIQKERDRRLLESSVDRLSTSKLDGVVGEDKKMQAVYTLVEKIADASIPVLLTGETGTGKGMIAKAIHEASPRRDHPYISLNCGAISRDLLESELFGHRKGAFTGADDDRPGLFEAAGHGTLFLDELGEAPGDVQVRLLQAIEDKQIRRVGENEPRRVNARIIAASNVDVEAQVQRGAFREDLYYRLKGMPIHMPPLRERREDIPVLADHFLKLGNKEQDKTIAGIAPEVMAAYEAYDWPGNVRELQHEINRSIILSDSNDRIELDVVSPNIADRSAPNSRVLGDLQPALDVFEREFIASSLLEHGWNVSKTCANLGISRASLQRRINRFGLERPPR